MLTLGGFSYPLFPEKIHLLLKTIESFSPGLERAPFTHEFGLGLLFSSAAV